MSAPDTTSRRDFLISTGALVGGGLLLAFAVPKLTRRLPGAPLPDDSAKFTPNAFLRIAADGSVTITVPSVEMGQGVRTALPQILAEELDADWEKIRVEQAPVDDAYRNPLTGSQGTFGSLSVRGFYEPLRRAGATARALLLEAGAAHLKLPVSELHTFNGSVVTPQGKSVTYGELAVAAAKLPLPGEVQLKEAKNFRLLGLALPRTDLLEKVNGSAQFGLDVRVPGMLTALIARPPALGARPASVDDARARAVKGVRQVLTLDSGVAVLAEGFHAAQQGRAALAIQWSAAPQAELSSEAIARAMASMPASQALIARHERRAAAPTARTLHAAYEVPFLAHATMEPMNCTVSVGAGGVEVWAPTQSPGSHRDAVAALAKVPPEQVRVHTTFLGGGFGRRAADDFVLDATRLALAAQAPVQLIYTREDDMRAGYYRPAARAELSADLDAAGRPQSFNAHVVCAALQAGGDGRATSVEPAAVAGLADLPYAIPNLRVSWSPHQPGVKVWYWRSVGHSQNVYFAESFIDELAAAVGKDPLDFRRTLLAGKPRLVQVLELAARQASWGTPPASGRARGIALVEGWGSCAAEVAEVSLSSDGRPRVHRVVCALDCGASVNPGIVRRQAESAIVYGLSAALHGQITLQNGGVVQGNFDTYPVLRLDAMPAIDVHLVTSSEPPGGVGELALPPLAPAVANALYALTGKRNRKLPLVG